jgi:hypothetical protein
MRRSSRSGLEPAPTSPREYFVDSKIYSSAIRFLCAATQPHAYGITYPRTVGWTIRKTLRFKKKTEALGVEAEKMRRKLSAK